MTPVQIPLVRDCFAQVQAIAREAAAPFYANLFESDPALRPLLRGDIDEQGRRLFDMIGAGISLLDLPAQLQGAQVTQAAGDSRSSRTTSRACA